MRWGALPGGRRMHAAASPCGWHPRPRSPSEAPGVGQSGQAVLWAGEMPQVGQVGGPVAGDGGAAVGGPGGGLWQVGQVGDCGRWARWGGCGGWARWRACGGWARWDPAGHLAVTPRSICLAPVGSDPATWHIVGSTPPAEHTGSFTVQMLPLCPPMSHLFPGSGRPCSGPHRPRAAAASPTVLRSFLSFCIWLPSAG